MTDHNQLIFKMSKRRRAQELETGDITTLLGVSPLTPLAGSAEASNTARTPAVARKTPTPLSGGTISSKCCGETVAIKKYIFSDYLVCLKLRSIERVHM